MAALTKEFDAGHQAIDYTINANQKGNTKVFAGALVGSNVADGYVQPAADAANFRVHGRAQMSSDATASGPNGVLADGVGSFDYAVGVFEYDNPAGANSLTQLDVGKLAYVLTDHEVCRAAGTVNSIIAGRVVAVNVTTAKATIDTRAKL